MAKVLVKFYADYADEFDVKGFFITTQKKWDKHLEEVNTFFKDRTEPVEVYFGTNECIEYDSFEEYKECFTVTPITKEENEVLNKFFTTYNKKVEFGNICFINPKDYEDEE
jgi:hypothetical protein